MGFNAKKVPGGNAGDDRKRPEPLEPGNYPVRLVGLITLGVQEQRPYQGEAKPPAQEIMLTYEFLDEFLKDDEGDDIPEKPRWLSETIPFINIAAERAKSTQRYKAFDPELVHDGDWSAVVGLPATANIVVRQGQGKHAGKVFENIGSVSPMRPKDAARAPELVNEPRLVDFYSATKEEFDSLPDWIKDKMKSALDYDGSHLQKVVEGVPEVKEEKKKKAAAVKPKPEPVEEDDEKEEW